MSPRRFSAQPRSVLAVWARRLSLFALPVALLAIIVERTGIFDITPVMATFGASLALAGLGILLGLAALVRIWFTGYEGAGRALGALFIGAVILGYPAYLGYKAYKLPAIHDITTDPYDPPRFEAVSRLRTRESNSTAYGGLSIYNLQRTAYPDVEPLEVNIGAKAAYDSAMALVTKRKWTIIDAREPQAAGRREGRIEAIAYSPVMGFRDDVVIRFRATGAGTTRIDMRSSSRYGFHDFGANARRIVDLLDDIDDAASPDKLERAARRDAAKKAPPKAPEKPAAQPARR
jgi:uncharacterized protein (DUF1499 family)